MKQQKINDTLITMQQNPSENDNDNEIKLTSRSTNYYPCDHFGNQINSDAFKSSDEHLQQISPTSNNYQLMKFLFFLNFFQIQMKNYLVVVFHHHQQQQ
jgi:hypothetical protein